MSATLARHWDEVFATRDLEQVSWHRDDLEPSLTLLGDPEGPVVDIGAGASPLPDALLDRGWPAVTALDVSTEALEVTRARLAGHLYADRVDLVATDVLEWRPEGRFAAWHDRAVFHFLTDPADQASYADVARRVVRPGGLLVLATFGPDGPTSCSGLPTARHDADDLALTFASGFEPVAALEQAHTTPSGATQQFVWVVLRRTSEETP